MVTSWRFKSSHPHHKFKGESRGSPFLTAGAQASCLPFADILSAIYYFRRFNLPPIQTPIAPVNGNVKGTQTGQ